MRRHFILLLIIFGFIQGQQRSSSSGNVTVLRDLEFEQIKLSYIQTDRALAVLKTLGYAVVEFRAGKGEVSGENNFTPVFSNKNTNLNAPGALPIIIKLPDSETISLVEKSTSKSSKKNSALGVDLGGVVLNNTTSGEPMQRFLVGRSLVSDMILT